MSIDHPESSRPLPDRPNLPHLKDQPKDLLEAGAASSLTNSGDGSNNESTSSPVAYTVLKVSSTTSIASSANPSAAGQSVTFTATVTGDAPGGTVTFVIDGVLSNPVAIVNGTAQLTTASLVAGSHPVSAAYMGDTNNTPSTSTTLAQVVDKSATSVTLTAVPNPARRGASVTLTADVAGWSGDIHRRERRAPNGAGQRRHSDFRDLIPEKGDAPELSVETDGR